MRPSGLLSCQGEGDESPFVDDPEPKRVDHEDFRIRGRRPWKARFTAHAGPILNIIQMVEYSPNVDGRLVSKYYQINFASRLEFDIISGTARERPAATSVHDTTPLKQVPMCPRTAIVNKLKVFQELA